MKADASERRRSPRAGQAMVEMALMLPLLLLIVGVLFTASTFLNSVVGLSQAARAGVITLVNDIDSSSPPSGPQQLADVAAAVNNEEGVSTYFGAATKAACTGHPDCVWITSTHPAANTIMLVHVSHTVVPLIPLVSGATVQSQAGSEP